MKFKNKKTGEIVDFSPCLINSALLSAQNRQRYYWCNWSVEQPEDRGIVLADVLESDPESPTYMSDKFKARNAHILRDDLSGKAKSLSAMEYVKNGRQGDYINPAAVRGRYIVDGKRQDGKDFKVAGLTQQTLEVRNGDKSNSLTTVQKDTVVSSLPPGRYPLILQKGRGNNPGGERVLDGKTPAMTSNSWEHNNHVVIREKSKCVRSSGRGSYDRHEWDSISNCHYRKLTPIECERLQTVPDNYTNHVSNTQRYKMLGNGWTVDVIAHIFSQIRRTTVTPSTKAV